MTPHKPQLTADQISQLPYRPCVGLMLVNAQGHVFVGQRLDNPSPAWQMPQGGIEKDEDPRTAALRELQEETGIAPDLVQIIGETAGWVPYDLPHDLVPRLWKGRFRGQQQKWFLMRFHGRDDQINIQTAEPEFSEWRWLAPDLLETHIVPFKRAVYADVLAELGPLI